MKSFFGIGAMLAAASLATNAHAFVLCSARVPTTGLPRDGGTVKLRVTCRSTEAQLDPVALALQGPAGPPGPVGTSGSPGPTGPQGPAGPGAIPCLTQVGSEAYFTGCNVNVRSGSGATDGIGNGLGNLVIGYNENLGGFDRGGSHNLVVGREHEYTSWGGLLAGEQNSVTAPAASVSGGYRNVANYWFATVSGGECNRAGPGTAIACGTKSGGSMWAAGGSENVASTGLASVSGGQFNRATGNYASVSGGADNEASGLQSSVSGGIANVASGERSSILGGVSNAASSIHSAISGGAANIVTGEASAISGGSGLTQPTAFGWSAGSLGAGGPYNGPHSSN